MKNTIIRVIVETPFRGKHYKTTNKNIEYARICMKDSLKRGEAPFLSHLLYTQCLDDTILSERNMGIESGLAWGDVAEKTIVYTDRGISDGMKYGIERAKKLGRIIEYRKIPGYK